MGREESLSLPWSMPSQLDQARCCVAHRFRRSLSEAGDSARIDSALFALTNLARVGRSTDPPDTSGQRLACVQVLAAHNGGSGTPVEWPFVWLACGSGAACHLATLMMNVAAIRVACRSGPVARNPVSANCAASAGCFSAAQTFRQAFCHSRHGQQVDQFPGGPRQYLVADGRIRRRRNTRVRPGSLLTDSSASDQVRFVLPRRDR